MWKEVRDISFTSDGAQNYSSANNQTQVVYFDVSSSDDIDCGRSWLTDHFKQLFVKSAHQNCVYMFKILSSGKSRSFCLHFKLNNLPICYSKKWETVHYFLAFG